MPNNKITQNRLDVQKYKQSQENDTDMSGMMDYCECCDYKDNNVDGCRASQAQREDECLCAKAYNRLRKSQRG